MTKGIYLIHLKIRHGCHGYFINLIKTRMKILMNLFLLKSNLVDWFIFNEDLNFKRNYFVNNIFLN